jgi:hypothetical protein
MIKISPHSSPLIGELDSHVTILPPIAGSLFPYWWNGRYPSVYATGRWTGGKMKGDIKI